MENQNSIVEEIERRRPVDVVAIERELAELWKAAAKSGEGGGGAVTRVCLLNLVIFTASEADAATLSDIVAVVTEHAPCRAMILIADFDSPESHTRAWISSHCHLSQNRQQVCCEEIRVSASGEALQHLGKTIGPLLIPDLPLFLWWRDPQSMDTELFQKAVENGKRLIVDTGALTHRDPEFAFQGRLIFNSRRKSAFSDLNWARLEIWRELISSFFDSVDSRDHLRKLGKVVIRFADDGTAKGVPIRALLLTGWLAGQLDWKVKDAQQIAPNHLEFRFRGPGNRIQVEIQGEAGTQFPAGVLRSVTLTSGLEKSGVFSVKRVDPRDKEDCFETSVEVQDGVSYSRVVSSHRPDDADLIAREVEIFGRDRTYERATKICLDLLEEIEADLAIQ
ncbi:MAG: glucose-6-phosphate dehydrogenase assembly protein OpcA [Blastocatellia bacterium]|nr:glucose-6-phosphate dehydrogenase assembly protein OpcA [Blastocatellia bacterium]